MKKSAPSVKRLKEIEPSYDHIHPFEYLCYVTISSKIEKSKKKLLTRLKTKAAIFLGYTRTEKQVRVWDFIINKVKVVLDVKIFERFMSIKKSFETYFLYWNKSYEHGFLLTPKVNKIIKEEKEEIKRLDNGGELILEPEPASNNEPKQQTTDSSVSKSLRKGRSE